MPLSKIATSASSSAPSIADVDDVPTIPLPPTPSAKLEISYLHHHLITFSPDEDATDSATSIKSITSTIKANTAGQLHHQSQVDRNDNRSPSPQKVKSISVNGIMLRFMADTLPEPPMLSYKTKGAVEQLMRDWTDSSLISIDGVGIPLCLWKKLYKRMRPTAWDRLKDQWTKYKFIVGGFKSFDSAEEFWAAMPVSPTRRDHQVVSYKEISECLRKMRNEKDRDDAKMAREKLNEEEFQMLFSYRKGGQSYIMSKPRDISRRWRLEIKRPVYWDEEESDEE